MDLKLNRRTFVKSAALLSAAACAFPWRARAAKRPKTDDDYRTKDWKYDRGRYWVACLGRTEDFGSAEPTLVKACYLNRNHELMDKDDVYVRWELVEGTGEVWSAFNAACTHLKCVVGVDVERKRYVCPCHGSEFRFNGEVTRRPAKYNLKNLTDMLILEDGQVYLRHKARKKEYLQPQPPPPENQPR
ncbi:Rieske 2Fe-2S domain-containing protein [bacterium]|nr:Rieske 2Fe-2S domain-containing protein [bacterium]